MKTKENKGVTLIALAVTIIVMLILAGVTISTLTGNSGVTSNASLSKIMNELSKYKEEVELYKANKIVENEGFLSESLSAGKDSINYNIKLDEETGNIKSIIPDITDEYINILQIIKGELLIKTKDKKQIKAAQLAGIQINPYDITDDGELLSSNGNLLLVDSEGTLSILDGVTKIGMGAFSGVEGLKTIIIPESVTEIKDNAFSNNKTLEKVIIKGELVRIGNNAFYNATNLKEINLPDSINYIGSSAFYSTNISEIKLPRNLEKVSAETFCECSKLKKIILNEGLKTLEFTSFQSCPIERIVLPESMQSIDTGAFRYCSQLKEIDTSKCPNFSFESSMLLNKDKSKIIFISGAKMSGTNTFEIPEGVTVFQTSITNYSNIKRIIISSTLQTISSVCLPSAIEEVIINPKNNFLKVENGIVYGNKNNLLMCYNKEKNIVIPEGIESIGVYAFWQTVNMETITLPESLKTIGAYVFQNCPRLYQINIGKNVEQISPSFYTESRYYDKEMNIDSNNPYYTIENNILYKKQDGKKTILVSVMKEINQNLKIDKETTTIGTYAFLGHKELKEFFINDGIKNINYNAFANCSNLKRVEISKSVNNINANAFKGVDNLEELIIYNKENSISGAPWGATKGMKVVTWSGK